MDMHAIIGTIAERVPTVPDPTDYVGDDGLIYCGHCNVAKETILDFGFMKRKVWCICNCGKQRRDANGTSVPCYQLHKNCTQIKRSKVRQTRLFGQP